METDPEGRLSGSTYESFQDFWEGAYNRIAEALSFHGIKTECGECMIREADTLQAQYGLQVREVYTSTPDAGNGSYFFTGCHLEYGFRQEVSRDRYCFTPDTNAIIRKASFTNVRDAGLKVTVLKHN